MESNPRAYPSIRQQLKVRGWINKAGEFLYSSPTCLGVHCVLTNRVNLLVGEGEIDE